jgi:hypothetical protein
LLLVDDFAALAFLLCRFEPFAPSTACRELSDDSGKGLIGVGADDFGVVHGFLSSLALHEWQQSTHGDCHGLRRFSLNMAAVLFWLVRLHPQKWQRFFPLLMA